MKERKNAFTFSKFVVYVLPVIFIAFIIFGIIMQGVAIKRAEKNIADKIENNSYVRNILASEDKLLKNNIKYFEEQLDDLLGNDGELISNYKKYWEFEITCGYGDVLNYIGEDNISETTTGSGLYELIINVPANQNISVSVIEACSYDFKENELFPEDIIYKGSIDQDKNSDLREVLTPITNKSKVIGSVYSESTYGETLNYEFKLTEVGDKISFSCLPTIFSKDIFEIVFIAE